MKYLLLLLTLLTGPGLVRAQLLNLSENFDVAPPATWTVINQSAPVGALSYYQGNAAPFASQAGAATAYIAANYNNTTGANTISTWLLTPVLALTNGSTLTFWARSHGPASGYADRLQVRMSQANTSTDVGTSATSVGDFTTLLLDINPTYVVTAFANTWTQYSITLSGLRTGGRSGRLAFRYFVENGGPDGSRSDYIGIDTFAFTGAGPLPVELVSFTAQASAAGTRLAWTTASEADNAYFAVERSADGREFTELARVAGAGSSQQARRYAHLDAQPLPGLGYYRLRQVDVDGKATYSPVRGVTTTAPLALYPNPTRHVATLTGAAPGQVVQVVDARGRVVGTTAADGTGAATFSSLAPGLYLVRVAGAGCRLVVE